MKAGAKRKSSTNSAEWQRSAEVAELQQLQDGLRDGLHLGISKRMEVYRLNSPPQVISWTCTCRPRSGRRAVRTASAGGRKSRIGWAFEFGKKICHSNSHLAETMRLIFARADVTFMPNSTTEVNQLEMWA